MSVPKVCAPVNVKCATLRLSNVSKNVTRLCAANRASVRTDLRAGD